MANKCPKCLSDNPDTSRFCGNCATSLTSVKAVSPSLTKTLQSPTSVFTPGTVISGHYEVLEKLGQGGMGEVYRALDKNLGRHVAIKILPEEFSSNPERVARFEREAKLLAVLNHPNIAAVYGFEKAKGFRFLALELVEGETLQRRLDRGALPVDEALDMCRQVAEGLEAAHDKGIVHRDLKPGNIMITPEGKVKILDFGLAKAFLGETTGIDIDKSPTITAKMTEPGIILGTAAYMSPEQARGRTADRRADIWAFGCVLYECLTGTRAFHGETVSDTLAQILKGEVDWSKLPAETPALIKVLLRRCLEKDPKKRLHDIADARIEIEVPAAYPSEAVKDHRRFTLTWLAASAVVVLLAGILAGQFIFRPWRSTSTAPVVAATIKVEQGLWLDGMRAAEELERPSRPAMAISNDGRFIVYSAIPANPTPEAKPKIYLRRVGQISAAAITGSEGGISPFLSPDDRWVGFWGDGKLKKVSVDGGVPVVLCDSKFPFGASWSSDNRIVFSPASNTGLFEIPAEGGTPKALTTPDKMKEEYSHRLPHWLRRGKGVLFTVMRDFFDMKPRVALLQLQTREWHYLLDDAADARYIPSGHIVFLRNGVLMAAGFNLDRLELTSQPVPVIDNVMQALYSLHTDGNTLAGQLSVSDSGCLVYASGGALPPVQNSLVWMDYNGNAQSITSLRGDFFAPRLSPDGRRIAYTNRGKEWRVWIYDIKQDTTNLLTDEPKAVYSTWTPDGKRVIFGWWRFGPYNLHWQSADESVPMERLMTSEYWQRPGPCSPDGNVLVFVELRPDTGSDIFLLDLKSRRVRPFLNSRYDEQFPDISPDGRWLAFSSNQSGKDEVYAHSLSGSGGRVQISTGGGTEPLWRKNGKQIFYRSGTQVWAADVRTDVGFSASRPRLLFDKPGLGDGSPIRDWDLTQDGQGFIMVKLDDRKSEPLTEMILIQNWFEELERLVPAGKK